MKNTLKTVITLLLISLSFTTYAQEKQNDATWEECIEFINVNIYSILRYTYMDKGNSPWGYNYSINNTKFIAKKNSAYKPEYSLILSNLKVAEKGPKYGTINTKHVGEHCNNFGTITIRTTNDLKMGEEYTGTSNDVSDTQMILIIEDDEMRERMLKAFKQIAYLAAEKRKDSKF
jgi:hypothetical protein